MSSQSSSSSDSSAGGLYAKRGPVAPVPPTGSASGGGSGAEQVEEAAEAVVVDDVTVNRLMALLKYEDDGTLRSMPVKLHDNTYELTIPDRVRRTRVTHRPVETTVAEDYDQYIEYDQGLDLGRVYEEEQIEQRQRDKAEASVPRAEAARRTKMDDYVAYALDNLAAIDPLYESSEREVINSGFTGTGAQATQLMRSKYRQKQKMSQRLLMIYQFFCMYLMFPKRPRKTMIFSNMVSEVLGMKIKQGSSYELLRIQRQLVILLLKELSV